MLVAPDLDELRGPTSGVAELPIRLFWNPDRRFDLDQPWARRWMYENVLVEAIRYDELRTWLDRDTLIRDWPELNLPKGVRAAWEQRHPVLQASRTAAA